MQNEKKGNYSLNQICFMTFYPSLKFFPVYYILFERKELGLHSVFKVLVKHGFACVHNGAFCFVLYTVINSLQF